MTGPKDPFGELAQAAIQIHELFVSFISAGFTEEQALRLTIAMLPRTGSES